MLNLARLSSIVLGTTCAATVFACYVESPPPAAPSTGGSAPVTTVVVDAAPPSEPTLLPPGPTVTPAPVATTPPVAPPATTPDFYGCGADSDCVAVPKVGCCNNGHKEAVNSQSVDAYKGSFVCTKKPNICPQYMILDKRVPVCGSASHKCEMVDIEKLPCSNSGPNPRACPAGYHCDAVGKCLEVKH